MRSRRKQMLRRQRIRTSISKESPTRRENARIGRQMDRPFMIRHRSGFTLVEVLVVIAIIGILVALLLPAIQAARESARSMSCQNNLKQLAIATLNYEGANKHFPIGVEMPYAVPGDDPHVGGMESPFGPKWLVFLLPYFEQSALYEKANPRAYPGVTDLTNLAGYSKQWRIVRGLTMPDLFCPSDAGASAEPFTDPLGRLSETEWAR